MISDISARLDVLCPDHEATRHLAEYVNGHLVDVGVVAMKLRLPLRLFSARLAPLEQRVYANLSALRSASDSNQTYSVDLVHKPGRAPFFSGALAIHTSSADDGVELVLAGHCKPPAGFIGAFFYRILGHRIAQASALDLLRAIAAYVEVASARSEGSRAGKRPYGSLTADYGVGAARAATVSEERGVATLLPGLDHGVAP